MIRMIKMFKVVNLIKVITLIFAFLIILIAFGAYKFTTGVEQIKSLHRGFFLNMHETNSAKSSVDVFSVAAIVESICISLSEESYAIHVIVKNTTFIPKINISSELQVRQNGGDKSDRFIVWGLPTNATYTLWPGEKIIHTYIASNKIDFKPSDLILQNYLTFTQPFSTNTDASRYKNQHSFAGDLKRNEIIYLQSTKTNISKNCP